MRQPNSAPAALLGEEDCVEVKRSGKLTYRRTKGLGLDSTRKAR
jgi:hypothetical protein